MAESFAMFSKSNYRKWAGEGIANTPLALYIDVDFEVVGKPHDARRILAKPVCGGRDLARRPGFRNPPSHERRQGNHDRPDGGQEQL